MTIATVKAVRVVLVEGDGAQPLDDEVRSSLLLRLLEDGYSVSRPFGGEKVSPEHPEEVFVLVGHFTETMPETVIRGEAPKLHTRSLVDFDIDGLMSELATIRDEAPGEERAPWKPWFPVIDYDRCTNCMQCLSFCLFDVYGVDKAQQIQVQNQNKCKTDCPACSRVCPEAAILFPKYKKGPINGDVVREEDLARESMKVDISALLGGDIYKSLRTRQTDARKRFSTERDESKALLERKRCLAKLKKDLDIPDEVLMTLPSAGDIQERAERAKEKAAKRAARSQTVKDRKPPTPDEWGI